MYKTYISFLIFLIFLFPSVAISQVYVVGDVKLESSIYLPTYLNGRVYYFFSSADSNSTYFCYISLPDASYLKFNIGEKFSRVAINDVDGSCYAFELKENTFLNIFFGGLAGLLAGFLIFGFWSRLM